MSWRRNKMFHTFNMGAVTVLLTTFVVFFVMISSSKASTCTEYQGGVSSGGVHRYICCNNCGESNPSCDGTTFQGGSNEPYCGGCGDNSFGGTARKSYDCNDCSTQAACAARANDAVFGYGDKPGLCWKWADSFSSCCEMAGNNKKRQAGIDINSTSFTFCGDGICRDDETPSSCPLDCCYQVNSDCTITSSCTPTCCGESSCCLEEDDGSEGATLHAFSFFSFFLIMLIVTLISATYL